MCWMPVRSVEYRIAFMRHTCTVCSANVSFKKIKDNHAQRVLNKDEDQHKTGFHCLEVVFR